MASENVYSGESSEEKAGIERSRIALRKQGMSTKDTDVSRGVAREERVIRTLMERFRLTREEAEKSLDEIGGVDEYYAGVSGVESDEYKKFMDRFRKDVVNPITLRGAAKARAEMAESANRE